MSNNDHRLGSKNSLNEMSKQVNDQAADNEMNEDESDDSEQLSIEVDRQDNQQIETKQVPQAYNNSQA